jgi:AcrR family transcriptional regulator/DNA-binding MarR family transcriptional regulator
MPARTGVRSGRASASVSHRQIAEIQRARLLSAAVWAVDELGYSHATVTDITGRARVSRRTFYELFANREECLLAVLEDMVGQVRGEIHAAVEDGASWRERVRLGLWAMLSLLDREPALARVCFVQATRGEAAALGRREELLGALTAVVDEGRWERTRAAECVDLTAEGLVGAGFAIVHARLLRGERKPLADLLGELMSMIVLPYLGPAAARREQARSAPTRRPSVARGPAGGARGATRDPLEGVRMRMTYRTARVLEGIAEHPGVSNRTVANYAGITDQGQISKLLTRLERLGLLVNSGDGHSKGEPNAWALTVKGQQVAQSIRLHARTEREAA